MVHLLTWCQSYGRVGSMVIRYSNFEFLGDYGRVVVVEVVLKIYICMHDSFKLFQ